MAFNLIRDPWIPVTCRSGRIRVIRPAEIALADDPAMAPAWPRADFNLACLELLIGLMRAACPPSRDMVWKAEPPDAALLDARLEALAPAFDLDGDGPRFLQDFETLQGEANGIDMLLIDSAGAATSRKKADLMARYGRYGRFGRAAAAMALFTLQSQAPAGGAGNRTSMRGGGPMITLVEPRIEDAQGRVVPPDLYRMVWANVPPGLALDPQDMALAFPWMRPTVTSEKGQAVQGGDHHPSQDKDIAVVEAFFGMPRRLRLVFTEVGADGRCDLTGDPDARLATGVIQRPYGTNYGVWRHPLTPYYKVKGKDEEILPVHPKPGRFGYRNWLGVVLKDPEEGRLRADNVGVFLDSRIASYPRVELSLLVGGWAMSNMSPLDFVHARQPLFHFADDERRADMEFAAIGFVEAARLVERNLLGAASTVFGDAGADKGDGAELAERFHAAVQGMIEKAVGALTAPGADPAEMAEALRRDLHGVAFTLFDSVAIPGLAEREPEDAARIVEARRNLGLMLSGYRKQGQEFFDRLGLPIPEPKKRAGKAKEVPA